MAVGRTWCVLSPNSRVSVAVREVLVRHRLHVADDGGGDGGAVVVVAGDGVDGTSRWSGADQQQPLPLPPLLPVLMLDS